MSRLTTVLGDLRYAGRTLRRSPGFALLVVVIMALGIGANTAVFSVVNAVLLKPLPYPGADRIVTLTTDLPARGERSQLVSIANVRDWRDESSTFEAMATYRGGEFPVSTGAEAEFARTAIVDSQFFRVFAVEPILGRTFTPEELQPSPDGGSMLIGHAYWQRRFGGDASVLQKTIRIRTQTFGIVGVLPAGFGFPNATDLYLPERTESPSRTSHNSFAVGRLELEVSIEQAQTELTAIASALEQQYPDSNKGRGVVATPLQEELVGDVRPTLYLLWGVKSLIALHDVDLGFRADNVLVMKATGVRAMRENNAFFTDVMARIAALPGVVAVGATSTPPGDFSNAASGAYFVDRIPEVRNRAIEPQALKTVVAPGTFAALGIPLTRGRDFNAGDVFDRPMVAVVNEALVENAFPGGQNPIGRTIFCNLTGDAAMTIVGVVGAAA